MLRANILEVSPMNCLTSHLVIEINVNEVNEVWLSLVLSSNNLKLFGSNPNGFFYIKFSNLLNLLNLRCENLQDLELYEALRGGFTLLYTLRGLAS